MKTTLFLAAAMAFAAQAALAQATTAATPTAFVPAGHVVVQQIEGDLNKDGQPDRVLLIKGTEKSQFAVDRGGARVDRNRRGLVIAFGAQGGGYTLALAHPKCFSSEHEDGGVYFSPELDVSVQKGTLRLHYAHGRYGYWAYTFRYQNNAFELIGFDSAEHRGPVVLREVSANFSTRKVRLRTNPNPTSDDGEAKLKESWKTLAPAPLVRLQDVADFDEFNPMRSLDEGRK